MKKICKRLIALLTALLLALAPMTSAFAETGGNSTGGDATQKFVDGTYSASMTLKMASGETSRRTFTCPDTIQVREGQAYATIGVDSTTYTYAKVGGTQYPVTVTGTKASTFEIPVAVNEDMTFYLYSSSMGTEIGYNLHVTATVPTVQPDPDPTPDPDPAPDLSASAKEWIQKNCVEGNIFINCSEAYQKAITKNGDTYSVPHRSSTNGTIRSSLKLLRPDATEYKSGWFFSDTLWFNSPFTPTTTSYKLASGRPAVPAEVKATLKLYAPETDNAEINNDTATALAEYTCTLILESKPASYTITLKAADGQGTDVEGAVYEVTDQFGNVTKVNADGTCTLYTDRVYTISAKAEGYTAEDGSETAVIKEYTPSQAETLNLTLKATTPEPGPSGLEDGTYTIDAKTDSSMFRMVECILIVQNGNMWAVATMAGDGFDRIYMGKAEYAQTAPPEEDLICYIRNTEGENRGRYTFWPIPISALDETIQVSGRSSSKGTWYDHDLILDSSTLKKVSDELLVPDMTMEAQKLMQQFYIDGNVFVQNGDAVTKSKSAYTIPHYQADGKTPLTQVTLKRPDTAQFKSGWTFSLASAQDAQWFTAETLAGLAKPASNQTYTLASARPTEPVKVNATLSFYAPDTEDAAINNGTAAALTSTNITFTISPQPQSYQVNFKAVDSISRENVERAVITVKDQYGNTVSADSTGAYTLNTEATYTVTAGAQGYVGQGGADVYTYTFTPSESTTIELPLTLINDGRSTVSFVFTDEAGKALDAQNVTFEVKDADGEVVQPQADGSYLLWKDAVYTYTASSYGYHDIYKTRFTVTGDETKTIVLKEKIKEYKVTIAAYSYEDHSPIDADIRVVGTKNEVETQVSPNADGTYSLDWETSYVITFTAEGFATRIYNDYTPSGNNVEVNLNIAMSLSSYRTLEKTIAEAQAYLDTVVDGDQPEQYPAGTKDTLASAIEAAKAVLNKEGAADEEMDAAVKTLNTAVTAAKRVQNPQVHQVTVRVQRDVDGTAEQMELVVRGDTSLKAGYTKALSIRNKVTMLDVLAAVHQELYGDAFKADPTAYLDEMVGYISKIFGTSRITYNYRMNHEWCDYCIGRELVADGTLVSIYPYETNSTTVNEDYLYFTETQATVYEGEDVSLTLMGAGKRSYKDLVPQEGYTVVLKNQDTGEEVTAVSDADGKLIFEGVSAGIWQVKSAQKEGVAHVILPFVNVTASEKPLPAVYAVGINVLDSKTETVIENAEVTVVSADSVKAEPEENGTYKLTAGQEYTITVSAEGYKGADGADMVTQTFTPTKDEVIQIYLEKEGQSVVDPEKPDPEKPDPEKPSDSSNPTQVKPADSTTKNPQKPSKTSTTAKGTQKSSKADKTVKTGDTTQDWVYVMLLAAGVTIVIALKKMHSEA